MKTQTILIYPACLILILSAGFNVYLHRQMTALSRTTVHAAVAYEDITDTSEGYRPADNNSDTYSIRELEYQLNAAKKELELLREQLADEAYKKKLQKTLVSNPVIKKAMKISIGREYAPLFVPLEFSLEEQDKFNDIFAELRISMAYLATFVTMADPTAEEREFVQKLGKETRENYLREIREFLGEEKSEIYDRFEDSYQERSAINEFKMNLFPEVKIDDANTYSLINSMYNARKSLEEEIILERGNVNRDSKAPVINHHDYPALIRLFERYDDSTGNILPSGQAESFKAYLKEMREAFEARLKEISQ
jgi:hypothetical protein